MKQKITKWKEDIIYDIKHFSFKNNKLEIIMIILSVLFYYPFSLLSPDWIRPYIGAYACSYTFLLAFILAFFSKKHTKILFPIVSTIIYIPSIYILYGGIKTTIEYTIIMLCYTLIAFFIVSSVKNVKDIVKIMLSGLGDIRDTIFGKNKKQPKQISTSSISSALERMRKKNEEDGVYEEMDKAFEDNYKHIEKNTENDIQVEGVINKNKGKRKKEKRKEEENSSTDSRDYKDFELF